MYKLRCTRDGYKQIRMRSTYSNPSTINISNVKVTKGIISPLDELKFSCLTVNKGEPHLPSRSMPWAGMIEIFYSENRGSCSSTMPTKFIIYLEGCWVLCYRTCYGIYLPLAPQFSATKGMLVILINDGA